MVIKLFIYLAAISVSTALTGLYNVPETVPCDRGWYYWGDKCYKYGGKKQQDRLSWDRALKKCKAYGGDLVSIHSQEEQDFITNVIQMDIKDWMWIGLHRESESNYRWTDGSDFDYLNWQRGEPTERSKKESCGHMMFDPENNVLGEWNDLYCDEHELYMCEMRANPRKSSINPMYCSSSAGSGIQWHDYCYYFVTEEKSWEYAEKHCKNYYDGHLVHIMDKIEDAFLDYILANTFEDMWIGIKVQNHQLQRWSSGCFVTHNRFNEINMKEGACIARRNRKNWMTLPCTRRMPFICKTTKEPPHILQPPARPSYCPVEFDGWKDLGGEYCYYFETKRDANFHEALFECKRRGGNLLSIHSRLESEVLLDFLKFVRQEVYIGLFKLFVPEGDVAWTDGSAVNFQYWKTHEPNNEEKKCVEMITTYRHGYVEKWRDISCEERRAYICSVKKIPYNLTSDEGDCTNFCIVRSSHLYDLMEQSPDAKRYNCP